MIQSAHAKVFINMDNTLNGFSSLFGTSRSFIQVNMDECPNRDPSTSCYRPSEDEIYVYPPHAWGEFGIFMVAHEYGHAFHADALWGNEASDSCNGLHHLDTESNLQCAYSEGFADFAGVATRPDLGSYSSRDRIAANDAFPGCAERSSSPPDYPCIGGTSSEGSVIEWPTDTVDFRFDVEFRFIDTDESLLDSVRLAVVHPH